MKKKMILALFLITNIVAMAFNFSVAPTRFELNLDKINTNEIVLINNTSDPMRLESFLEAPKGYEKYNLNDNIKLYPKMVAIKPGGKQLVRFRVKPSKNMVDGEYKSYIVFKEVPLKLKDKKTKGKLDVQIKMITEVGISVYGSYGNIILDATANNMKISYNRKTSGLKVNLDTFSKGNSSVKLSQKIEVLNSSGKVIDKFESQLGRTARNGMKKMDNTIKIPNLSGKKVRITVENQDGKKIIQKTSNTL